MPESAVAEASASTEEAAPKARRTAVRRPKTEAIAAVEAEVPAIKPARASTKAAPRTTASRAKAKPADEAAADAPAPAAEVGSTAEPKRRVTRRKPAAEG